MVCFLFATNRVPLTPFNSLLLNLSIADLMADIFSYPYIFIDLTSLRNFSKRRADLACAFTIGLTPFWIVTSVSLLTLCFISMTRYVLIKYPFRHTFLTERAYTNTFLAFVWPISIALPLPNFFSFSYDPKTAICYRVWPNNFNGPVYSACIAVFGIGLPGTLMLFTFISTARSLWKRTLDNVSTPMAGLIKRRKAVKLLGFLIVAFLVCWGPFFVYFVLSRSVKSAFPDGAEGEYLRMKIIRAVILVALCNTSADPIIYGLRSEEFRKGLKDTIRRFSSRGERSRSATATSQFYYDHHGIIHVDSLGSSVGGDHANYHIEDSPSIPLRRSPKEHVDRHYVETHVDHSPRSPLNPSERDHNDHPDDRPPLRPDYV